MRRDEELWSISLRGEKHGDPGAHTAPPDIVKRGLLALDLQRCRWGELRSGDQSGLLEGEDRAQIRRSWRGH